MCLLPKKRGCEVTARRLIPKSIPIVLFSAVGRAVVCSHDTTICNQAERTSIIADSTQGRMWRTRKLQRLCRPALFLQCLILLLLLLAPRHDAFDRLRGFDTSGANQLRGKMRRGALGGIGQLMQFNPIAHLLSISH